jgi:hypothetical protein
LFDRRYAAMGIGVAIFLVTIGAILKFAITVHVTGVDIQAIGMILMVVGGFWFIVTVALTRRRSEPRDQEVYDDGRPPAV